LAVDVGIDVRRRRDGIDRHRRRQDRPDHHFSIDDNRLNRLLRHVGDDIRGWHDRLNHADRGWNCDHHANRRRGHDRRAGLRHDHRNAELKATYLEIRGLAAGIGDLCVPKT